MAVAFRNSIVSMFTAQNSFTVYIGCNLKKSISKRNLKTRQLQFDAYGDPLKVLKVTETEVPKLNRDDALVRMLAAPINPSDINTIEGKYPVKIQLPCIGGNEGVGIIEETGTNVKNFVIGDKVIILRASKPPGTWRNFVVYHKEQLRCIPKHIGLAEAASMTVNPCAAYRMLSDYETVRKKKLVVMQNGGNSACGQNVIQLCKAWGIPTVNVVRNKSNFEELKTYLHCLGANCVLTEEQLKRTDIFKNNEIKRPTLALNCIGGNSATGLIKHMAHSGRIVTYGGMSKKPVTIPAGAFIFKNLRFNGFWLTAWYKTASKATQDKMFTEIINLMCEKKLVAPPHQIISLDRYKEALTKTLSPPVGGCKYFLDLTSRF